MQACYMDEKNPNGHMPPKPQVQRQWFVPVAVTVAADLRDHNCACRIKAARLGRCCLKASYIVSIGGSFKGFQSSQWKFSVNALEESTCCCVRPDS